MSTKDTTPTPGNQPIDTTTQGVPVFHEAGAAEARTNLDPNLPPPGDYRRDELAKRKETLDQAVDELTRQREVFALDASKFDEDREILSCLQRNSSTGTDDYFAAANLDHEHFAYSLIQCMYPQHSPHIFYNRAKLAGWAPVTPSTLNLSNERPCVTSSDCNTFNTSCGGAAQIGDLILMMMPIHRYKAQEKAKQQTLDDRDRRRATAGYNIPAMPGSIVHSDPNDPMLREFLSSKGGAETMQPVHTQALVALANEAADRQFSSKLKDGTVGR